MSQFIKKLIPRLRKYNEKVDLIESLVDKVWTIYGNEKVDYEFVRGGEIVVTKKW